jgi:putative addiction module component (TIGR02574 family)
MMRTQELISEAISLPLDERSLVVDCLLKSFNPTEAEIDKKWAAIAKQRLNELRTGQVKAIPGDEVFKKIRDKFA